MPVGKPAPPRPRRPDSVTSLTMSAGAIADGVLEALQAAMRAVVVERQRDRRCRSARRSGASGVRNGISSVGPSDSACVAAGRKPGVEQRRQRRSGRHRAVGDAALRRLDLDHRLQPVEAARAVADDLDVRVPRAAACALELGRNASAPTASAPASQGTKTRAVTARPPRRSRRPLRHRAGRSAAPSSMADGATAQRPRQ